PCDAEPRDQTRHSPDNARSLAPGDRNRRVMRRHLFLVRRHWAMPGRWLNASRWIWQWTHRPPPPLRLQHGTLQVWRIHHTIERGDGTRWRAEVDMHIVGGQGRFFPVGG